MKSYIIIFFVVLLAGTFTHEATAQKAPGLYGKRLFVEFGTSFMSNSTHNRYNHNDKVTTDPNIDNEPTALESFSDFYTPISYNFQLDALYAISRIRMVGGGLTYSRLGFGKDAYPTSINANVTSLVLNVYLRNYSLKAGSIAPIGTYFQYGLSAVFNNRSFRESTSFYDNPEKFGSSTYINPAINLEWGKTTILADKLLFTFATQSTLILPYGIDTHSKQTQNGIIDLSIRESKNMYSRIFLHYGLRFKIAVGLPFKTQK